MSKYSFLTLEEEDLFGNQNEKSIRGLVKVEVAKKVQLEGRIKKEKHKLKEIRDNPEYNDGIWEDIRERTVKLNDDLH